MNMEKYRKPLIQRAKPLGLESQVPQALERLQRLLPHVGELSKSKQMIGRVAACLLADVPVIIAPSCPDYSLTDGVYDFRSIGGDIPHLARLQAEFLEPIVSVLPECRVEVVLADQDVDDAILLDKLNIDPGRFSQCVAASVEATKVAFAAYGWTVQTMTSRFPDIRLREQSIADVLTNDASRQSRINSYTVSRRDMCAVFGITDPTAQVQYTIRAASQYSAMAQLAHENQLLVCNHEPVNHVWFQEQQAAVLHNPLKSP